MVSSSSLCAKMAACATTSNSRQFASVASAALNQQPSSAPPLPASVKFRPLKATDIAPVLKPLDVLQWGIQIERNCSDGMYQQIAQQVVDECGWDNSTHDYGVWLRAFGADNFSLFFAVDKELAQPVASVSMALYQGLAQVSMFFINSRYRGRQLGHKLFRLAMDRATERIVFCYGVADMWAKYASDFGLSHFQDWQLWNLQALSEHVRPLRLELDSSVHLEDWRRVPFEQLAAFDRQQTDGLDRANYLAEALAQPESLAKVALDGPGGQVTGLCQARRLLNNRLGISLFYARDGAVASTLLRQVLLEFAGPEPQGFTRFVYKTPSTNKESIRLFDQLVQGKLVERQELVPQFSRPAPAWPGQRIFSIGDEHASAI